MSAPQESSTRSEICNWAGAEGHVFILMPLSVSLKVQFLTCIPCTSFSATFLPRLPMLIPWPGPHITFCMDKSFISSPMEIQSSPVPMTESVMLIIVSRPKAYIILCLSY
ncbi:hypothetical protein CDL12_15921 [Handroanthus impetiginosus]|uniref:Uncharacterized protein n=1 Tax=Handroanthus impetiginosus TaxID=429701 RepID=A0A2G9H1U6_9LAMI|nr:hypothetical protein CDL12_15921 [Handroanthus impetiginosus]